MERGKIGTRVIEQWELSVSEMQDYFLKVTAGLMTHVHPHIVHIIWLIKTYYK